MEATNLLINLALLESLKGSQRTDELDLYLPYIALTVDKIKKESFVLDDIKVKLIEAFNFSPPDVALKVLLTRAKNRGIIKLVNQQYFKVPSNLNKMLRGAREKQIEIERSLNALSVCFVSYAKDVFDKEIDNEEANFFLYDFISKNISTFVSMMNGEKFAVKTKVKNKDYLTACFIKHLHDNVPVILTDLDHVIKGTILANYLSYADKTSSKKTYENVTIYLDGPLILGLLGYSGAASEDSLVGFLKLVDELNVKVKIFDVTFDEVESIITAWKIDLEKKRFERFRAKTIELIRSKGLDSVSLETEIALLKSKIENFGIEVVDNFEANPAHYCDVNGLESSFRRYGLVHDHTHDIKCVARVHNTRISLDITSFDKEFSIFVTHNQSLEKASNRFFKKQFSNTSIPIVTSDRWIATVLWLKKPDAFSSVPSSILLASSYSIIYADDEFWRNFIERLEGLKEKGSISEEDFILVRWDRSLITRVHDVSIETGKDFKDADVFEMLESLKNLNILEKQKELEQMKEENNIKVKSIRSDLSQATSSLDLKTKKINKFADNTGHISASVICFLILALMVYGLFLSLPKTPLLLEGRPQLMDWKYTLGLGVLFLMTLGNLALGSTVIGIYSSIQKRVSLRVKSLFE